MTKIFSVLIVLVLFLTGCSRKSTYYPDPVSEFSATYSDYFTGESVVFTNTSSNAVSYDWDFGDGTFSGAYNPTHAYANSGDYTIILSAFNQSNIVTTSSIVIHVYIPATLNLKVFDYTKPLSDVDNANIDLYGSLGDWNLHNINNAVALSITDANGIAIINNLFPGDYYVDIYNNSYDNKSLGINNANSIVVTLHEGATTYANLSAVYLLKKSASVTRDLNRKNSSSPYHHPVKK